MSKGTKKRKILKTILILLVIMLVGVLVFFGTAVWYINNKLSKINYVQLENIEVNEGVQEQLKGHRNIAIFGIDARADTYTSGRSDCIMIASIDEASHKVNITSIYRDSYLYIDDTHGYDKITHAYAYGGPQLAINALNRNLDLNISEFVTVNFDAVIDIIDAVGGVNIEVDSSELQYINGYIEGIGNEIGRKSSKISKAGTIKLDGVQALAYSRIRYTAGGDFKRTERMREVLNATFAKAKTMNIKQLNDVADKLLPKVYTNVSSNEIISLVPQIAQYSMNTGDGWPYENQFYNNGVSYVAPVTLEKNVEELHKKLFNDDDYEASSTVEKYSNGIIKKTGYK